MKMTSVRMQIKKLAADDIKGYRKLEKKYGTDYSAVIARLEMISDTCDRGVLTPAEAIRLIANAYTDSQADTRAN